MKDTQQLLDLDCRRADAINGFGQSSADALEALQHEIRRRLAVAARAGQSGRVGSRPLFSRRFSQSRARRLPLFCGGLARSQDLDQSYYGTAGLEELELPSRLARLLRGAAIATIGQLLCTSSHRLLHGGSFGLLSLEAVQRAVLDYLKRRNGLVAAKTPERPLDFNCFESMVTDVVRRYISRPKWREALRRRIGLGLEAPQTLAEIGRQFGVSREMIRQRERKAVARLSCIKPRRCLAPFFSAVRSSLDECGNRATGDQLAKAVATRLGWPAAPSPTVLRAFLAACAGHCGRKTESHQLSNADIARFLSRTLTPTP